MDDVARLGIDVDSSSVQGARKALEALADTAGKTAPKIDAVGEAANKTKPKVVDLGNAADGAGQGLKDAGNEAGKAKPRIDGVGNSADGAGRKLGGAGGQAKRFAGSAREAGQAAGQAGQGMARMGTASASMERNLANLAGMANAAKLAIGAMIGHAMVQDLMKVQGDLDKFMMTMTYVTGSTEAARQEFDAFAKVADSMGVEIQATMNAYASFAAAAKSSGIALEDTRTVFAGVSGAMMQMGRSSEETQRALVALQQMLSSGKVQTEELREQFGEAFPLAMSYAARALGFGADGTEKLNEALENGTINAKAFVVEMGRLLYGDFGQVGALADTTAQQMAELENATLLAKKEFLDMGGGKAIQEVLEGLTKLVAQLQEVGRAAGPAAEAIGTKIGNALEWFSDVLDRFLPKGDELQELLAAIAGAWSGAQVGARHFGAPGAVVGAVVGGGAGALSFETRAEAIEKTQKDIAQLEQSVADFERRIAAAPTATERDQELRTRWEDQMFRARERLATLRRDLAGLRAEHAADQNLMGGGGVGGPATVAKTNQPYGSTLKPEEEDGTLGGKATIGKTIKAAELNIAALKKQLEALSGVPEKTMTASEQALRRAEQAKEEGERQEKLARFKPDDPRRAELEARLKEEDELQAAVKRRTEAARDADREAGKAATERENAAEKRAKQEQKWAEDLAEATRERASLETRLAALPTEVRTEEELKEAERQLKALEDQLQVEEKLDALRRAGASEAYIASMREQLEAHNAYRDAIEQTREQLQGQLEDEKRLEEQREENRKKQEQKDYDRARDEYEKQREKVEELRDAFMDFGQVATDALLDVARGSKSASDALREVLTTWLDMAAQMAMQAALSAAAGYLFPMPAAPAKPGTPVPMAKPSALGNVFERGELVPFARGGIVTRPTTFPMPGQRRGLMGESGPESVMPLRRMPDGKLGVHAAGAGNNVAISTTVNLNGDTKPEDAERISKEVEKRVARAVDERLLKHSRQGGTIAA